MKQLHTLNAKELMLDWTSGQGATGKNPASWTHVKDGHLQGIELSIAQQTALVEMAYVGKPASFYTALRQGFLSPNHASQHDVKTASPVAHVIDESLLSSEELEAYWLEQLKPAKPVLLDLLTAINDADADIAIRIDNANSVLAMLKEYKKDLSAKRELSQEQLETLANKRKREQRFVPLYERGFSKVLPIHGKKGMLQTRVTPVLDKVSLLAMMDTLVNADIDVQTLKMEHDIMTDCSTVTFQDSK